VVADYGADQTGNRDSTLAFNLALNKAPGPNIVCVPPGEYAIGNPTLSKSGEILPHDITIGGPSASAGGALIGPANASATIVQHDQNAHVIDSCPVDSSSDSSPVLCKTSLGIANAMRGWKFANLTLRYESKAQPSRVTAGHSSIIHFPSASHVEVDSVTIAGRWRCNYGSETGDQTEAAAPIAILLALPDGTDVTECIAHFIGVHGGANSR
jgi:hypothetical protein